ncbi:MAG: 3-methyladenine DNA glycosylase [Verrucomicrobiota bacterium]
MTDDSTTGLLAHDDWRQFATKHRLRAEAWTVPYRKRRASNQLHPIHDFLFIYYRNAPSQLEAWHPTFDQRLEVAADAATSFNSKYYSTTDSVAFLDGSKIDGATYHRLEMALRLSRIVHERPTQFGCYGLHEWAMVYRGNTDGEIRHSKKLPLRLSEEATDAFIESRAICCSHYDAFRFFTPSAKPFNRIQPSKETRHENEQAGCLHTNMDLYKLAAQCMPWIGSDLLWRTFEFAVIAREIDMRASPYDCRPLGYEPICIETSEGRADYEREQRALTEKAKPIRQELIRRLQSILEKVADPAKVLTTHR